MFLFLINFSIFFIYFENKLFLANHELIIKYRIQKSKIRILRSKKMPKLWRTLNTSSFTCQVSFVSLGPKINFVFLVITFLKSKNTNYPLLYLKKRFSETDYWNWIKDRIWLSLWYVPWKPLTKGCTLPVPKMVGLEKYFDF